jgi:ABC-type sugar transport system ATPase subunit
MAKSNVVLEIKNITKEFPGVKSLDGVDFRLHKGEVLALVGENGAGKSTLMKIIAGIYQPDTGEIYYKDSLVKWESPLHARAQGISVIHQELQLSPNLSVGENVLMGSDLPKNRFGLIKWRSVHDKARALLQSIGSDLNPETLVSELSISQKQIVEIARSISIDADIIIMDEPSATLTGKEITKLFQLINLLKSKGIAVIYISHRMEEIFEISDTCTILRDGQFIAQKKTKETNEREIVQLMVGRDVSYIFDIKKKVYQRPDLPPLLSTKNLSDGNALKNGSINVYPGEVVGISGLVGAGRTELMMSVFGSAKNHKGSIYLDGKEVVIRSPIDAIKQGIALVPESRKEQGLFLQLGVDENISVLKLEEISTLGFLEQTKKKQLEKEYSEKLLVKTPSLMNRIENLSGGNQQKAIIARWLTINPKILLLDEPTRGIDVGAKSEIYSIINDLADEGYGVIVVSSDLPEILHLSNRVFVMRNGETVAELSGSDINQETIMLYATGGQIIYESVSQ